MTCPSHAPGPGCSSRTRTRCLGWFEHEHEGGVRGGASISKRRHERGVTLIELLVYLTLLLTLTGVVVGADQLARRIYRSDAARLAWLQRTDRVLDSLADDFLCAGEVAVEQGLLRFEGGARYERTELGELTRSGELIATGVTRFSVEAVDTERGLYRVTLALAAKGESHAPLARTFRLGSMQGGVQ